MHAISVRRRSEPLKQSQYEVPEEICFSSSLVWDIMAMVESASKLSLPSLLEVRRRREALASATRPLRTSHQGDSGAKMQPIRIGRGQIH